MGSFDYQTSPSKRAHAWTTPGLYQQALHLSEEGLKDGICPNMGNINQQKRRGCNQKQLGEMGRNWVL